MVEVRRQFREIAGIMEYKADPDYASCVALCTKGALREMVAPALLAIAGVAAAASLHWRNFWRGSLLPGGAYR